MSLIAFSTSKAFQCTPFIVPYDNLNEPPHCGGRHVKCNFLGFGYQQCATPSSQLRMNPYMEVSIIRSVVCDRISNQFSVLKGLFFSTSLSLCSYSRNWFWCCCSIMHGSCHNFKLCWYLILRRIISIVVCSTPVRAQPCTAIWSGVRSHLKCFEKFW